MLAANRLWASDAQKPIAMVGDSMGYRISGSRKESWSTQDYFGALAARRTAEYHVVLLISIIISQKKPAPNTSNAENSDLIHPLISSHPPNIQSNLV